eukprot:34006-Eustigmatos_ZCMA.PRE.1
MPANHAAVHSWCWKHCRGCTVKSAHPVLTLVQVFSSSISRGHIPLRMCGAIRASRVRSSGPVLLAPS